jgi:predicted HTH transcriptional regulator
LHKVCTIVEFKVSPGEVSVTFFTKDADSSEFVEKFAEKFVEKFVENEVQREIIRLMLEQPTISAKAIAEKIGMPSWCSEKY